MSRFVDDLKQSVHGVLRAPRLLLSAVLCLGLGLGASATMLGVLDQLLFRPPAHVRDSDRLVHAYFHATREGPGQAEFSYPMFADLAGRVDALSGLALYFTGDSSLGLGIEARKVRVAVVTPSFFPLLGVVPALGRLVAESDGDLQQAGVAVVSWEFWKGSLGGKPDILGRQLRIGKAPFTVVGVLPARFTGVELSAVDAWLPVGAIAPLSNDRNWWRKRNDFSLQVVGRLAPGATLERAAQEATAVHRGVYLELRDRDAAVRRISFGRVQLGWNSEYGEMTRMAGWMAATAIAVLLLACTNVAHLLILRGLDRRRELAVRLALGASRARIARLLLLEGLVLGLLGGVAGWVASRFGGLVAKTFLLPPGAETASGFDLRWLALLAVLSVAAGVLAGLGPVIAERRGEIAAGLQGGAAAGGPARSSLRALLLAAQVAFTVLLLLGAGYFVRSLRNVLRLDLGLDTERVLTVVALPPETPHTTPPPPTDAYYRRILDAVSGVLGVERAALAVGLPLRSIFGTVVATPEHGDVKAPGGASWNAVTPSYFATVGLPLRLGRALEAADEVRTDSVAVINETMARLAWPGQSPLGRCFQTYVLPGGACTTVVGVVGDFHQMSLREPPTMQFFLPLAQAPKTMRLRYLFVRAQHPDRVAEPVRREILAIAPDLPYVDERTLASFLEPQIQPWRMCASLLSLFGVLALAIAFVGLFSGVAYTLAARTRELGVRLALGARYRDLERQAVKRGLGPAVLGTAFGALAFLWASRFVAPLLFDMPARDPLVTSIVVAVVLLAALAAAWTAAQRVRRIEPTVAMRAE